jgi:VanZ family protein
MVMYSAAMAIGYALIDEVHQFLVPGRRFEVLDLFLDASGAGLTVFILLMKNYLWKV